MHRNVKVGWLVDSSVFSDYYKELAAAVMRQGHTIVPAERPAPPYHWDDVQCSYRKAFRRDACVVVHGDVDLVLRIQEEGRWTSGVFANVPRYFCSHYYAYLGRFLINRDYAMLPYAELPRCRGWLMDTLGRDGKLFARPDSPLKLFTGLVISADEFEKDYEYMGFYEFPIESLIVVSSPKPIDKEWRFVVANGEVVTGTQYKAGDEQIASPNFDPAAARYAQTIVDACQPPDAVYVVDVCQSSGDLHLLEIGGFSFADLYACDKDRVVKKVSAVAAEQHRTRLRAGGRRPN